MEILRYFIVFTHCISYLSTLNTELSKSSHVIVIAPAPADFRGESPLVSWPPLFSWLPLFSWPPLFLEELEGLGDLSPLTFGEECNPGSFDFCHCEAFFAEAICSNLSLRNPRWLSGKSSGL